MTTFGYMVEFFKSCNNPYFMHEVLPWWVALALVPFIAPMVAKWLGERW